MKDSFLLYTEIFEQVDLLTDEQAGKFIKAVLHYEADMDLPELDGVTAMVFSFVRQKLDRDAKKYDEICEKRRIIGAKGGRQKKANSSDDNQEKPNGFEENQKKPIGFLKTKSNQKKHDNDHEHEHDHDNEHDNDHGKDKTLKRASTQGVTASGMVEARGFSGPVQKTVLDWINTRPKSGRATKRQG